MAHFLIVEARFYEGITDELVKGAVGVLEQAGVTFDRLAVPGALEIPAAIRDEIRFHPLHTLEEALALVMTAPQPKKKESSAKRSASGSSGQKRRPKSTPRGRTAPAPAGRARPER